MATWQNLVDESGGDTLERARPEVQEGSDITLYAGAYVCLDDDGNRTEVDLDSIADNLTMLWEVYDAIDGAVVLALECSVVDNQIRGYATAAEAAGLAGTGNLPRRFPMSLTLTYDGATIPALGPDSTESLLIVKQGA